MKAPSGGRVLIDYSVGRSFSCRLTDHSFKSLKLNACANAIVSESSGRILMPDDGPMISAIHDFRVARLAVVLAALLAILLNNGLVGDPHAHSPGTNVSCHDAPSHVDHKSKPHSCVTCIGCALEIFDQTPVWKESRQILAALLIEVISGIHLQPLRRPPRGITR